MTRSDKNKINNEIQKTSQNLIDYIQQKDQIDPELTNRSWQNVDSKLFKTQSTLRSRILRITSAAACILIILSSGWYLFNSQFNSGYSLSADLLNESLVLPNDSTQEILLITQANQMNLKEDASVQYKSDGSVLVDSQEIEKENNTNPDKQALNHIIVPKGKRINLTFSDGTKMFVNAGSHVIYPTLFEKGKREIVVEGEVFLDVAKDPQRPFIVKVNGFDVKVLGTSFNICAYKEDPVSSVVLVNGHVEVKTNKNETIQLQPNQLVNITPNGTESKNVEVFEYICWKDNMMLLSGRKSGEIFNRLARYYGYNIEFDHSVEELILQGKLDLNENIRDVMDMICLSLSLKYVIDENTISIMSN